LHNSTNDYSPILIKFIHAYDKIKLQQNSKLNNITIQDLQN